MAAPTLILLHGVGLDHTVWDAVIPLLPGDLDVRALDLPGHGTRAPAPAGVTLADLASGVADDIPSGSHLVGFSLGALVAQQLAITRPELVATLTSVSSVCRRTPDERAAVLRRLDSAGEDFTASAQASLRRWYEGTTVDADHIRRTRDTLLANDPASFVNCYRVFATADAELDLDRITAPALAVTGEHDPGSTPEMTHRLAAALPDCTAAVVPGARHMLPVERPGELTAILSAFIGRYAHV